LIQEHRFLDELTARTLKCEIVYFEHERNILENNLFGVDINEESVEITQLALWLRTARRNRKLGELDNNIKCGNSLISDTEIAGKKAFDWQKEFPHIFEKGGFDIVIGNPPYGAKIAKLAKKHLNTFYPLVPDFQSYIYFISLYTKILKEKGVLSFIVPNTFLSNLFGKEYRDDFVSKISIYQITDLSNDKTFDNASVRTCILTFSNEKSDYQTRLLKYENNEYKLVTTCSKSEIQKESDNLLNLFIRTHDADSFTNKIVQNSKLGDYFTVSQGLIPYDKYRGHDEYTVKNRIWHCDHQKDKTYKKELKGGDVSRYMLNWNGKLWISYGDWLAAPRDKKFFTSPRILVREITADRLFCTFTKEEYYNTPSIINIIDETKILDLHYCLAVLNSKLIGWLHNNFSPKANKGLFPKILINDIRNIPLKKISAKQQRPFIILAEKMLSFHNEIQNRRSRFLKRLADNFETIQITETLKLFDKLDFKQFLAELKKQKINIFFKQQDQLEEYFNEYQTECNKITWQISDTDRKIDQLVYEIYGLTENEINIIEGR
jgi:hypothetical protein